MSEEFRGDSSPEAFSEKEEERAARGKAASRRDRAFFHAVNAVSLGLVLLPVVAAFLFVYAFGVDVIFHDQQRITPLFEKLYSGTLGFSDLFALHNEHRIMFPRIAMLALGTLTAYSNVAEMYFMQVCILAALVIFWLAFRVDSRYRLLLFAPVAFLLFSFRQYQSTLQGLQISVVFAMLFSVLAFYLLYLRGRGRLGKAALPAAIASAVVASFSFAQGLFVWPVGLGQLLISPLARRAKAVLAAIWGVAGAASWFAYFVTYEKPPSDRDMGAVLERPAEGVEYVLGLAGSALFWEQQLAIVGGLLLAVLTAAAVVWLLAGRKLGEYSFWLAVLAFALAFLLTTMVARVETGAFLASRYASFSLLTVIGLYALLAKLAADTRSSLSIGMLGALLGMVAFSLPITYAEGLREGYMKEQDMERLAFITYTYETQPDSILEDVFPSAEIVSEGSRILDELDYNVFAYRPEHAPPPLSGLSETSAATDYDVEDISGVRADGGEEPVTIPEGAEMLSITGWAIDSGANAPAGGVYVEIDGEAYPAFYGVARLSVAQRFGPEFRETGFARTIARDEIEPGEHELSLLIVSDDGQSYYRTDPISFEVQ